MTKTIFSILGIVLGSGCLVFAMTKGSWTDTAYTMLGLTGFCLMLWGVHAIVSHKVEGGKL